jgi:hypothetical protein
MGAAPQPATGRAMVNVFDGTRQLYSDSANLLISVIDGNQHVLSRQFHKDASVLFTGLPIAHNFADNYSVLAAAGGYKDAGFFPVKMAAGGVQIVNLMLLPNLNQFNFSGAAWSILGAKKPDLQALLAADLNDTTAAEARYNDLKDFNGGQVLACLLNILTAMDQIALPQKTPIHYLKSLIWDQKGDNAMAQDRFYGWADPTIIDQLEASKNQGTFVDAPFQLHKGATRSYKQIQFGEANVQLTFHEGDRQMVGNVNCVKIEPDIDYFRDSAAHLLLEVAVNAFGSLTDPRTVYALRWMAGQRAGIPEFDPLYTIQRA